MAPTSLMAMPTSKPKIGFSIDSIVGNGLAKSPPHFSPNSEGSEHPLSPLSDSSFHNDHYRTRIPSSPNEIQRALRLPNNCSPNEIQLRINRFQANQSPPTTPANENLNHHHQQHHTIHQHLRNNSITRLPESPPNSEINLKNNSDTHSNNNKINSISPPPHQTVLLSTSPSDQHTIRRSRSPSPQSFPPGSNNKGPIVVPGIPAGLVRPFPVGHPGLNEMKTVPPYPSAEMMAAHNPHFLAAQFQMAAALAHGQGQGFPPGGIGQHPAHIGNPNMARDSYPLYPWLLSRHGRIFPHRFPGSKSFY